jgi:hypothetical protein
VKQRRLFIVIAAAALVTTFGGMAILWLNDNCADLSQGNCRMLWGTGIASVLGGMIFTEALLARRKVQAVQRVRKQDPTSIEAGSSGWYVWFRPIAWVVLASLLSGLPLILQGALVVTVTGTLAGLFLDGLMRGIANRLPPVKNNS